MVNDRINETSVATNGQTMRVIVYRKSNDIDIEFEDGTIVKHKSYYGFKLGNVRNPNAHKIKIGETYTNNQGLKMKLITYRNYKDIDVQFDDGTIVEHKQYENLIRGSINNPNVGSASDRIGETSINGQGLKMKIVAYRGATSIDIEFEDGTILNNKQYTNFSRHNIVNPNFTGRIGNTLGNIKITGNRIRLREDKVLYPCSCLECNQEFILTYQEMVKHTCNK
jgi:uncharacterized protein YkvS